MYILPIKRAYHYLDYSGYGCLSREEVQKVCKDTASLAGINFTEAQIAIFVKTMEKNGDHEIDCEELIETVIKLRDHMFEITYQNSQVAAAFDAGVVLQSASENGVENHIVPFGWSSSLSLQTYFNNSSGPKHEFTHDGFRPLHTVPPLQRNMATATYLATRFCAAQVANARRLWRDSLLNMKPEDAAEYNSALRSVEKAIAKSHLLDPEGPSPGWVLDNCLDKMEWIPLELFEDLKTGLVKNLLALRNEISRLLDPILAFVWSLKPPHQRFWMPSSPDQMYLDVKTSVPTLSEWRRLRMLKFSTLIDSAASKWTDMKDQILQCREWNNNNEKRLSREVSEALTETKSLYEAQVHANREAVREFVIGAVRM